VGQIPDFCIITHGSRLNGAMTDRVHGTLVFAGVHIPGKTSRGFVALNGCLDGLGARSSPHHCHRSPSLPLTAISCSPTLASARAYPDTPVARLKLKKFTEACNSPRTRPDATLSLRRRRSRILVRETIGNVRLWHGFGRANGGRHKNKGLALSACRGWGSWMRIELCVSRQLLKFARF
jgi:hypothetical protein